MSSPEPFIEQVQLRLDNFYCELARLGEVAPGPRFRLEGFLEAGLSLGLCQRQALLVIIAEAYRRHMGQDPIHDVEEGEDKSGHVELPVLWKRAPVYRGSAPD